MLKIENTIAIFLSPILGILIGAVLYVLLSLVLGGSAEESFISAGFITLGAMFFAAPAMICFAFPTHIILRYFQLGWKSYVIVGVVYSLLGLSIIRQYFNGTPAFNFELALVSCLYGVPTAIIWFAVTNGSDTLHVKNQAESESDSSPPN